MEGEKGRPTTIQGREVKREEHDGTRHGSLHKEAYESLKGQVEAKLKATTKSEPRQRVEDEEVTSKPMQTNDVIDTKVQVQYNDGTTKEDVVQATFLSCDKKTD